MVQQKIRRKGFSKNQIIIVEILGVRKELCLEVIQRKPAEVDSLSLEVITSPTKGRNINNLNFACHKTMFCIIK